MTIESKTDPKSETFLFTSESVTEGHPDKVADQISDHILDSILEQDKKARVACETLVTTGMAVIAGEITTNAYVEMPEIVRQTIKEAIEELVRSHPYTQIDYIHLCDPVTLEDVETLKGETLLALAVRVGKTRLIDNCVLGKG